MSAADNRKPLTERQAKILAFIKSFITENQFPPTVREICAGVGLKSTSSVAFHLESLERAGYIRKNPSSPRAMVVIERAEKEGEN